MTVPDKEEKAEFIRSWWREKAVYKTAYQLTSDHRLNDRKRN